MLSDCETYQRDQNGYVLENGRKKLDQNYQCGNGAAGLQSRPHCCSLELKNLDIGGSMKKCMPYNEGDSPFGTYNYPNSEQSLFDFSYKCPSFVANCSSDDKCGDTQDHCCNLKSIDP